MLHVARSYGKHLIYDAVPVSACVTPYCASNREVQPCRWVWRRMCAYLHPGRSILVGAPFQAAEKLAWQMLLSGDVGLCRGRGFHNTLSRLHAGQRVHIGLCIIDLTFQTAVDVLDIVLGLEHHFLYIAYVVVDLSRISVVHKCMATWQTLTNTFVALCYSWWLQSHKVHVPLRPPNMCPPVLHCHVAPGSLQAKFVHRVQNLKNCPARARRGKWSAVQTAPAGLDQQSVVAVDHTCIPPSASVT